MTDREAMQMAFEALDCIYSPLHVREINKVGSAMQVLRAQLAQQAEPVSDDKVICPACCHQFRAIPCSVQRMMLVAGFEPPYTTPPQRKPLRAVTYVCPVCAASLERQE